MNLDGKATRCITLLLALGFGAVAGCGDESPSVHRADGGQGHDGEGGGPDSSECRGEGCTAAARDAGGASEGGGVVLHDARRSSDGPRVPRDGGRTPDGPSAVRDGGRTPDGPRRDSGAKSDGNVQPPGPVAAFPGAEGFGAKTIGGRGGKVFQVTNLNDSGAGSLRECVAATGARVCVFKVGGTIVLNSALTVANPNLTIAGQTAPGGGITLTHPAGNTSTLINVATSEVIIRYLSSRPGAGGENHALTIGKNGGDVRNVVIDHCSLSWGVDEVLETWYRVHETTIQWTLVSEALDCSTHSKGCHSKGVMLGSYASSEQKNAPGAYNISFHHNLIAHSGERGPLVKTCGVTDVVNNVIYNPFWTFSHVDLEKQLPGVLMQVNYLGNYFKYGTSSSSGKYEIKVINDAKTGKGAQVFVQGNLGPHRSTETAPELNVMEPGSQSYLVPNRFPSPAITTSAAAQAYQVVLAGVGNTQGVDAQGGYFWRRDAIDQRIVADVKNGTGKIIDDPSQVGGWLAIASGTPYGDSDGDGMSDAWERNLGLNPNQAADGALDRDGDGYTNLEEFLNGTNPNGP